MTSAVDADGERLDRRPALEPGEVPRNDAFDLGLLQHHLGDEDRVRVARVTPGEVAAVRREPRRQEPLHRARVREPHDREDGHDADRLPGGAVHDEPLGLLRPPGALRELHAQAVARALAHGRAHADLDGDHAAQRRRGRLRPRGRPRPRARRLAGHARARRGERRLAGAVRARAGGGHPRPRLADLARREVVGLHAGRSSGCTRARACSTSTASTRTTGRSAAASSPATRTGSSTAR